MALTKTTRNMIGLGAGGSYSTARDAIAHQVWDQRFFAATISDTTLFTQPIGAPWRVGLKTKNETNMQDSGKLPNGQTFLVTRMGVGLISAYDVGAASLPNAALLAQAFVNVMQSSVFELRIAGREYDFQIHGSKFLPQLMVSGMNAVSSNGVVRVGDQIASGWVKISPSPIFIDELVTFNVAHLLGNPDTVVVANTLNHSTALLNAAYSSMIVTLEGLLTRAK